MGDVSLYEERVLPRLIDLMLGNPRMDALRRPSMEGLDGVVVEIGFGSGPNLPLYPPGVTRVLAVDPSGGARKLAARRLATSSLAVDFIGLDGESLPLDDDSVDNALSTWTLCTIPDPGMALSELRRVLRPGGQLHFLEHGRAPDPRVRRWQQRLEPVQKRIAGGCHLTRDVPSLIEDAGFDLVRSTEFDIAGPKPLSHMFSGVARA